MIEIKNITKQLILDIIMVIISIFMTFDYYNLIISGDNLLRRKIVLVVWIFSIIGWSIKFVYNLRKRSI
jgi:hypothetical protein